MAQQPEKTGGDKPACDGDTSSSSAIGTIALWIVTSSACVLLNKYIMFYLKFNCPTSLALMHMMSASLLTLILVHGSPGGQQLVPADTRKGNALPLSRLMAVAVLFALSLVLATAAFMHLSVPVIQMLRAGGPAATYIMGVFFNKEQLSAKPACQIALLTLGVVVAAAGEFEANAVGVVMQVAAIFGDATRFVLMQIISQGEHGVSLSPIGSLYYVAPLSGLLLLVPAALLDGRKLAATSIPWGWLLASCCTASLLNLLVFTLVGKTSALTANVTGPLRDLVTIIIAMYLYGTSISLRQWIGYGVAVACIFWYHKTRALDTRLPISK